MLLKAKARHSLQVKVIRALTNTEAIENFPEELQKIISEHDYFKNKRMKFQLI